MKYKKKNIPYKLRLAVAQRDKGICQHCGIQGNFESGFVYHPTNTYMINWSKDNKESFEVDHIMPEYLGGKTTLNNLQLLCKSCNAAKGAKYAG